MARCSGKGGRGMSNSANLLQDRLAIVVLLLDPKYKFSRVIAACIQYMKSVVRPPVLLALTDEDGFGSRRH